MNLPGRMEGTVYIKFGIRKGTDLSGNENGEVLEFSESYSTNAEN